nr:putative inorganic phosphate cotransporter [Parasteatoda tepidariorum]
MIPARFVLTLLGFLGYISLYAMRVNLNVAIVAMVGKQHHSENGTNATITCAELIVYKNETNENYTQTGEFTWDSNIQGQVVGSYFYGYIVTQIPGGLLAERYGAKWIYGFGILMTSLLTFLSPIAARWNVWSLVALRVAMGLAGGVSFPAMNVMIGKWVPKTERSRISTTMNMGVMIGTLLTNIVTGQLSEGSFLGGWPSVFYVSGLLGSVWFVLWALLIHEKPEDHPRISKQELIYIQDGIDNAKKKNGLVSGIPYLMMALFALPASVIADFLRAGDYLQVTTIRKIMNSIAFFGPALCAVAIAFTGCRPIIIIILFSLSFGLNGLIFSSLMVNHVDMSPNYAGTLFGITNGIATLPGFLAPLFVGALLQSGQTLRNWGLVYLSSAGIHIFTGLFYDIFASSELQPWNDESEEEKSEKKASTLSDTYSQQSKL